MDSGVLIDALRGNATPPALWFRDRAPDQQVAVGDIVLLEVLRGVASEAAARRTEAWLRGFAVVPMLTPDLAVQAAMHYRRLRGLGITLRKTPDLVIGTWCIAQGVPLLHRDRDYDAMAAHLGLRVVPVA